jgi:peptidoglycan/LPS O-acetylase OafA/YrhL
VPSGRASVEVSSSAVAQGRESIRSAKSGAARIDALDFTKGALVLFMVLYHWLNYFVASQGGFYRYLRFLTPSFIFITGFLISSVYFSKYKIQGWRISWRLMTRGLKILGLFVLLNVLISLLLKNSYDGTVGSHLFSRENLFAIFVSGNTTVAGGKAAAFYVLVPISYLLLLAAGVLVVTGFYQYAFHAAAALSLCAVAALGWMGVESTNLELVAIGLLGAIAGYIPLAQISRVVKHLVWVFVAYLFYLGAITFWDVIYPLQIVGVGLTLMLLYILGSISPEPGWLQRHTILLGKYSLFGYIVQVAILQLLHRGLRPLQVQREVTAVSFILAFALTMASVEAVNWVRSHSPQVNWLYKVVFS